VTVATATLWPSSSQPEIVEATSLIKVNVEPALRVVNIGTNSPRTLGRTQIQQKRRLGCYGYREAMSSASVEDLERSLVEESYLAGRGLAVALFLALAMERPLLLEGEPGVGKTEVARTLARIRRAELIRLQCYEGIDAAQALYEWNYARQLLHARTLEPSAGTSDLDELYREEFLVERPLLAALRRGSGAVLLIDEIDRADDEFEAFLLEVLADFSVTVPEIGTIAAESRPVVILTSNRTRELHDALKRRCLYHWIDYPDVAREAEIVRLRVPGVSEELARSVAQATARLREIDLIKPPGPAESIDWAASVAALGAPRLDSEVAGATLGAVIKNRDDLTVVAQVLPEVLA